MLRTQTETMSATIGGVDSFTVHPYDDIFEKTNDFSERIARNQQLLLKEESHFDKIVDPAGGSYYIEELTQFIAEAAWKLFLEVQEQGGMVKALEHFTGNHPDIFFDDRISICLTNNIPVNDEDIFDTCM